MPMNQGLLHEEEMITHLNNKRFCELSNNLKNLVHALFPLINDDDLIQCAKADDYIKPDFYIECQGKRKYISMKSGSSNKLHSEYIRNFVLFLRSCGISKETQRTILLYHYGDGTLDGSAEARIDYPTLRLKLNDRIRMANRELNQSKEFIQKVIEHCIDNYRKKYGKMA